MNGDHPRFREKALAIVAAAEGLTNRPVPRPEDELVEFDPDALAAEVVETYAAKRESRYSNGGAPSLLGDAQRLSTLLQALSTGLHRETAARVARISPRTLSEWCSHGTEQPQAAAGRLLEVMEFAEAYAELTAKQRINEAGKLAQQWTANAWSLERRNPDRWAKRTDDAAVPRVVVQIGVRDGDVQVSLGSADVTALPSASDG